MSRTYRKDRFTTEFTLREWVNRELERHHTYQGWNRLWPHAVWLQKYNLPDDEIVEKATAYWEKHKRDGKGCRRGVRELAIEGKVCGWRDGAKSIKALPKRAARRQQKEAIRKFMKEYTHDDDANSSLDFII